MQQTLINQPKLNSIGIMQGRLTPSNGRGIQFFPFDSWEKEFQLAESIGLDEIEFIFDYDKYQDNPLWSESGLDRINNLIRTHEMKINHICADFFMVKPFWESKDQNINILKKLIQSAVKINAHNIEIPLVDNSSIKTKSQRKILIDSLNECLADIEKNKITLSLETDLNAQDFLFLLEDFNHPFIRANYDSGNSSGLGYDHTQELKTFGSFIENVHIKDRILNGSTVELGTGSADFNKVFKGLKEIGYNGSLIMQVVRGSDGSESNEVLSQIEFIKQYMIKYGFKTKK